MGAWMRKRSSNSYRHFQSGGKGMSHSFRHHKKRTTVLLALGVLMAAALLTAQHTTTKFTPDEASKLGTEAYIYGYPLVTVEMTRRVLTNVEKPEGDFAPMGQFANLRKYPSFTFRVVTAPNADTLYSSAFLDLTREPYVLSLPNEHGRYYLMPMLSAWTDVFQVPGTRTTGTDAQTYVITGPGWKGTLPQGITEYKSPTNIVWIIGRTYSTGTPEDYKAVHAIQDGYKLVPLSAYGKPYTPPLGIVDPDIDMVNPVRAQVDVMDPGKFFNTLAHLMKDNPPAPADAPIVEKLKRLGIVPGQDFDLAKADPVVRKALQGAPKAGLEKITSTDGSSRRTLESTARTIFNGRRSRTSHWAPTGHKTLSIPLQKRMRPVSHTTELTSTSYIFRKGRCHPSRLSGPSRCTTPNTSSSQTISIVTTSASATI